MRLRDLAGIASTVIAAVIEHWLGETAAVAVLTFAMVMFAGLVWRRVSLMMAAPRADNCTKSYEIEGRLNNYITIMAALAPLVTANNAATIAQLAPLLPIAQSGDPSFLAGLRKLPDQTATNSPVTNSNGALTASDEAAINGVITAVNNLQVHLQGYGFES